ncbi:MAG: hypothetical protein ABEI58_04455 [Candidatus Nanohaloarchaea archaeon]
MTPEELDREKMEHYFLEEFPDTISLEEAYPLLLLVLDERPGALVMSAGRKKQKLLEKFAEDFQLAYRTYGEQDPGLLDRLLHRETPFSKPGAFLARDPERFDIIEEAEGGFYGTSDEAVGEFLGYPESAIEYYRREETLGSETLEKITGIMDNGDIAEEERRYLDLTTFIPEPDKNAVKSAIETGKRREALLKQLDRELDTSIGEKYLEARTSIHSC